MNATTFTVVFGSVTDFTGDAIVNAANEGCLGGGGIDGRICDLGGSVLAEARRALPILDGTAYGKRCDTGDAKLTVSGDLPCDFVIHAVGPRFGSSGPFDDDLALLKQAYKNALERAKDLTCAKEQKLTKVAFCILSAGTFRGGCSLRDIIHAGVTAIAESIAESTYPELGRVFFCAFTDAERSELRGVMDDEDPVLS